MKIYEKTYDIQGCIAHGFGNPRELNSSSTLLTKNAIINDSIETEEINIITDYEKL